MSPKRGRSIELFFVDGTPDGMVTATIPFQWSGHVLVTRRTQLKEALERDEALRPGVYLLVGDRDGSPTVYIGETDELRARTKQHAAQKDWWETVVLISSSGEPLNKAHARYLEYRLYMRATQVAKVTLGNSQSPTESKLSDAARAHMDDFLENIYLVLPALRFDLFTQNAKPQAPAVLTPVAPLVHFVFEVPKNGIKARAHIDEGDFVVEAGSLARRKWEGAVHATYMPLHQELLDQGILADNGQHAIFTQSFGFSSASAAAAVVAGRPASGPKSWIVEGTGQSLGDLEAKSLGEKTGTDFVE
ncbi:GIY-YIG nuclease family protein [Paracoccus sp. NSM]|uniref:GIY-YIG nuclease family protein n=1 Tax=Paracoccus sp. NSM TaxID=3457784 RepID=UPI0040371721